MLRRSLVRYFLLFCCIAGHLGAQTINIPAVATGDGAADDTVSIQTAINSSPLGAVIDFGSASKIYRVTNTITFPGGRTYTGAATIKLALAPNGGLQLIMLPLGNADDTTISGLTFDAGGFSAVMHIATTGVGNVAPTDISITGCTFKNSIPGNNTAPNVGSGIYNTVGVVNLTLSGNTFANLSHGLSIVNPSNLVASGNTFQTITSGDAMYFQIWEPLSLLMITNNVGNNFYRMAVEIQTMRATGSFGLPVTLNNVTVQNNDFENWTPSGDYGFGLSLVFQGANCTVSGNRLLNGVMGYGIEDGSPGCVVDSNTISGFAEGIGITTPNAVVTNNQISGQSDSGIEITNANAEVNTRIVGNTITNAKNAGIQMVFGDHHGSLIQGNSILRQGGAFPDDATVVFSGIVISGGLTAAITVNDNSITQTAVAPVPGFGFFGIAVLGNPPGSVYDGNNITSNSTAALGIGFDLGNGPYLDGDTVQNTSLRNLLRVSNGFTSGNIVKSNNVACNVTFNDPNLITSQGCSGTGGLATTITSPAQGQTVSGTISITATASGGTGIAGVQFAVDGSNIGPPATFAPYNVTLNTSTLSNGGHTLTAYVQDTSGNTASSAIVVIVSNGVIAPGACPAAAVKAFTGCYYTSTPNVFSTLLLARTDPSINFDWTSTPDPPLPSGLFSTSAHWIGNFTFEAGAYIFTLTTNDGSRLWIDPTTPITVLPANPVLDQWYGQNTTTYTAVVPLTAGTHLVRMDYFKSDGGPAVAKLS